MEKYKVLLSMQAKNDYKEIINYIKYELLEPAIAEKYANLIKNELTSLEYQPNKFPIINYEVIKKYQFRKLVIKKYIAFYRINNKDKVVNVERILYGASDWKNKL